MRRCLATGQIGPKDSLIRFVLDPDRQVVPDVTGALPGRGLWVTARRDCVEKAMAKGVFARAAKGRVVVPPDLPDHCETLLAARALSFLGLARRAGELVLGFDQVEALLATRRGAAVLIAAIDGAADGRRKLAVKRGRAVLVELFASAEMDLALGRENVIHAALKPGGLADRFVADAARVAGFRAGAILFPTGDDGGDPGAGASAVGAAPARSPERDT